MCFLFLSEILSYACIIPTQCTCGTCSTKSEGGLELRYSSLLPHQWTGLKETKKKKKKKSSPPHAQVMSLGEGSTSLVVRSAS